MASTMTTSLEAAEAALSGMSSKIINYVKEAYESRRRDTVVEVRGWNGVARTTVIQHTIPMIEEAVKKGLEEPYKSDLFRIVSVHISEEERHFAGAKIRSAQAAAAFGIQFFPDEGSSFWYEGAGRGLKSLYSLVIVHLDSSLRSISLEGIEPHRHVRSTILIPALSPQRRRFKPVFLGLGHVIVEDRFDVLSVEAALGLLRLEIRAAVDKVLLQGEQRSPAVYGNKKGGSGSLQHRRLPIISEDTALRCFLYSAVLRDVLYNPVHVWRAEGLLGDDGFEHAPEATELVCNLIAGLVDGGMLEEKPPNDTEHARGVRVCAPLVEKARVAAFSTMWEEPGRRINASEENNRIEKLDPPAALCSCLPDRYPNLCTLVLKGNGTGWLQEIPDEVFSPDMPSIRVIDLSGTAIRKLPSSLTCCRNLRMLSLNRCMELETLPPTVEAGRLAHLEVLSVMGSPILGMTKLSLRHMRHLKALCFHGAFHNLEELHLSVNNGRVFQEYFTPDLEQWPSGLIKRAHILVYSHGDSIPEKKRETSLLIPENFPFYSHVYRQMEPHLHPHLHDVGATCDKHLEIHGGEENVASYNLAHKICQPDFISLCDHQAITHLNLNVFIGLTDCRIQRCHQIETAFLGDFQTSTVSVLKNLYLSRLRQLRYMCSFSGVGNLTHLTNIHIEYCQNLVALFGKSAVGLPVLEELEVKFCGRLQSIFGREIEEGVDGQRHLPSLKKLHLCELPQLASICSGYLPSVRKFKVRGCWKLRNLPLRTATLLPNTEMVEVEGEKKWWDNVVSKDGFDKQKINFKGSLYPPTSTTRRPA